MFNPSEDDYIFHYKDYIQHIQWLMEGMAWVQQQIMKRMLTHDRSKIGPEELDAYAEVVPGFKNFTYGTPEHKAHGDKLGPAWQHHTEHNKHHVEHFEHGISDMTLIDLIEMVCDWRAAALRSGTWDYETSLTMFVKNSKVMSPQIVSIIRNTCRTLDENCQSLGDSQRNLP